MLTILLMMSVIDSPTSAFSKLQGAFSKIIPIIGIAIGFFIAPYFTIPTANWLKTKLNLGITAKPGFSEQDILEYTHWIPTGLIWGGGIGLIAYLVKHFFGGGIMDIISNALIGVAIGVFLFCLYVPWDEDIGFKWY